MKLKPVYLFVVLLIFIQCGKEEIIPTPDINVPAGNGHSMLSEYNFFLNDINNINPNEEKGVIPYDLNVPLFSDYATKDRFIYIPDGMQIQLDQEENFIYPIGSVLIKHFYYTDQNGVDDHIETRLLIKRADDWQSEIYIWNEEQTNASRSVIGATKELNVFANGQTQNFKYLIPNQNQCKNCHDFNNVIKPLGPNLDNLNKSYTYSSGTENQIQKWIANGLLVNMTVANLSNWSPINDQNATLDERARAYLDVNCASCHSRTGSAENSGLYLEFENQDSLSLGFWKTPVAAGDGSGGLTYVIKSGDANESILLYRMIADAPDERMPEIGRELLHDEGIQLIRDWINSME